MLLTVLIWGQIPWKNHGGEQCEIGGHSEKGRPFQDRECRGSRATWCASPQHVHTLRACFDLCGCTLNKQRCPQPDLRSNSKQRHLDLGKREKAKREAALFQINILLERNATVTLVFCSISTRWNLLTNSSA